MQNHPLLFHTANSQVANTGVKSIMAIYCVLCISVTVPLMGVYNIIGWGLELGQIALYIYVFVISSFSIVC